MPGLMALALALISMNFAFDYLRTTEQPPIRASAPVPSVVSPQPKLGFQLGAQPAAVYRAFYRNATQKDFGGGTAWLIDATCGIFVTNAHVAADFDLEGHELFLQQPQTAQTLKVTARALHPARAALLKLYDQYGPIGLNPAGDNEGFAPDAPLDVALLSVAEKVSPDCKLPAGVTLPEAIAFSADILDANPVPGTPVAIVHYPGTGNSSAYYPSLEATPRVEFGTLRALGSSLPVPYDLRIKTPLFEDFMYVSAQSVGGSSGSVVLGPSGTAIGLNAMVTAGVDRGLDYQETIAFPARIVAETMTSAPDTLVAAYVAQAKLRFQTYLPAQEYLSRMLAGRIDTLSGRFGTTATKLAVRGEAVVQSGYGNSYCAPGGGSRCILASDLGSPFSRGWFTRHRISIDSSKINVVAAIDMDLDIEATEEEAKLGKEKSIETDGSFCPIGLAQLGDGYDGSLSVLDKTSLEGTPSLVIPAAYKGMQSVDILIFRPSFCSEEFLTAHVAVVPFTLDTRAPSAVSALEHFMRAANRTLIDFGQSAAPPLWPKD